jgi:hypothetical protein
MLLEYIDYVFLALDEIVDDGYVQYARLLGKNVIIIA